MRERSGQILRIACLVLAALVLCQLASIVLRVNPLRKVTIPALPTLAASTNTTAPDGGKGTNSISALVSGGKGTNTSRGEAGTNSVATKKPKEHGTNVVAREEIAKTGTNLDSSDSAKQGATNDVGSLTPSVGAREKVSAAEGEIGTATNPPAQAVSGSSADIAQTNSPVQTAMAQETEKTGTNSVSTGAVLESTEMKGTNSAPSLVLGVSATNALQTESATNVALSTSDTKTNISLSSATVGTNFVLPPLETHGSMTATISGTNISLSTTNVGTNSASLAKSVKKGTNSTAPPEMAMAGMRGGRAPAPELPPEIKARVDRIYESEILGQVMRPLPMALMGIAGNSAFLRSPGGQTGLVKEGDSLGEIKLLRIGINRVLVEQDGQKKELMIFEGYGGESLLPKEKETPK
jgi:hypothetical protein